ncbi:MAG TPA: prepilin-type N-terminal cleavage/methylation domain-containing protein [Actinomycetota bacterium]|nr:prepilin-type N-terminal cleavage/methylation domain-containing protein [Actinomycetota bacterium]
MRREEGFTLSELLVACLVMSILLGLGAYSLRRYWQTRALHGSIDEVVSELRTEQQKASSESHPWVWGVWFKQGSGRWGVVRGNASTGTCALQSRRSLPASVTFAGASFADVTSPGLSASCANEAEAGAEVALFFPRGTATEGSVSLRHLEVGGGAARTITVSPITGRVTSP